MGLLGSPFPRPSLSYCERDRSDEPVRILYSAEPSVGSKRAIGCSNILSFGKPLEGLKAGNRRSNNRTIYVRMRLTIYLFIYLFIYLSVQLNRFHFIHWNGALEGRNHDCQQTVVGDYVSNRIVMANEERIQCSTEGGALE